MEKINVAELLKDCPKGMELDCYLFDRLEFDRIDTDNENYPIVCRVKTVNGEYNKHTFTKYGWYSAFFDYSKCVILPKGKTTWEGFHRPFKVGDIVFTTLGNIAIIREPIGGELFYVYGIMVGNGFYKDETAKVVVERLATEEEKAELFDAIKASGYRWNAETKTLEKLVEHRFKVGDRIRHKCPEFRGERIVNICCDTGYFTTINDWIDIEHQDDWELVSDKLVEPKFKVGDRIKLNTCSSIYTITDLLKDKYRATIHSYDLYEIEFERQDAYELVPNKFDINTLVPFESKVLVRHNRDNKWCGSFFSHIDEDFHSHCYKFVTTSGRSYPMCIPYEGNELLLGKTDDCHEYFKNWK